MGNTTDHALFSEDQQRCWDSMYDRALQKNYPPAEARQAVDEYIKKDSNWPNRVLEFGSGLSWYNGTTQTTPEQLQIVYANQRQMKAEDDRKRNEQIQRVVLQQNNPAEFARQEAARIAPVTQFFEALSAKVNEKVPCSAHGCACLSTLWACTSCQQRFCARHDDHSIGHQAAPSTYVHRSSDTSSTICQFGGCDRPVTQGRYCTNHHYIDWRLTMNKGHW